MKTVIPANDFKILANPLPVRTEPYARAGRSEILSLAKLVEAEAEITSWPGYRPTPLVRLDGIADAAAVQAILYKDEGSRFGLGSFKALGGAYAVFSLLQGIVAEEIGRKVDVHELIDGSFRNLTEKVTVTCATDGNHGRSVAWGAQMFGCRCVIYVHEHVSLARQKAIAAYGAEVRVHPGNYDEAVRQAAADAAQNQWITVSDTSYEGYTVIPRDVMQGYGVALAESFAQMTPAERPTHVFMQAGVGGVAASFCSYLWERFGEEAPRFIVVEPERADCVYRTLEQGSPCHVKGELDTIMAGLACGEVSIIAWEILKTGMDAVMTITDQSARDAMCLLADAKFGDTPVVAGESAVAGLAGFLLAAQQPDSRKALGLDEKSVIYVFGTEGATDPYLYEEIVGRPAEVVAQPEVTA
ncbi:diaminopropionate ammonia-lyase [Azospirillum brasilense]|nr:diaminopropionate ammonia-lyase [Azospirillum brasilense]